MPKETFHHLSTEKKEKIEKAIENELGRTSFEKASISRMIEEAKIPRGSFYQYFEDKEDAITYILKKYMLLEKEVVKKILSERKGNIFEAALAIFDHVTSEMHENLKINLYKNIMQELKKNNINLFDSLKDREGIKEINQFIDVSVLNLKEENDLKYIMKIISTITRSASIDVSSGNMSKKEAREELEKQIEILKRGMAK